MEETRIIESLSILLYSRSLDTLYIQFSDSQSTLPLGKLYLSTSAHTWIDLATPLKNLHAIVKRNQQNIQTLQEFTLLNHAGTTLENMGHYLKLKKVFDNFELLFQIFFKPKSLQTLITNNNLSIVSEAEDNIRLSEQERRQIYLTELKKIASQNLALITTKATAKVLNPTDISRKKKTSVPSEEANGRPFRKRKDKKTFTYNARINKMKKDQGKKTYLTPTGMKFKGKARSEREMTEMTNTAIEAEAGDTIELEEKKVYGNGFFIKKPKKPFDFYNTDEPSSQATKLSFSRKGGVSKNKITFLDTSLSIGTQMEEPEQTRTKKESFCIETLPAEIPLKYSYSIHHNIEEDNLLNQNEIQEQPTNENSALFKEISRQELQNQCKTQNVYEKLKFLCSGKSESGCNSKDREFNHEKANQRRQVCRSQEIPNNLPEINYTKKCSNLTKFSHQPQKTLQKTSKFKQNFYQDLYLETLSSIENQNQILMYAKAQCESLGSVSVSVKRQRRQYTTLQRGKQNMLVSTYRKTESAKKFKKGTLQKKKKPQQTYMIRIEQVSIPVVHLKY